MSYVDPQSVHNPATGTSPPAAWGDTLRNNFEFLVEPPGVQCVRTTVQSIPNDASTAVQFDAADTWDTHGFHSTVTNNTRVTVPSGQAGKYQFEGVVYYGGNATGWRVLALRRNNTTTIYLANVTSTSAVSSTILNGAFTFALAAGDFVEMVVWHGAGAALDIYTAYLTARWVGR